MVHLLLALLGAGLFSLGRCTGEKVSSSRGSAGHPPCLDENGLSQPCNNGTYGQIFFSYDDSSGDQVYRQLCLPMPNGTYTIGGPCDPSDNKACTPEVDGSTPYNQTVRCSYTSILNTRKPGNDSYNRLIRDPYARDSAVTAWVGICLQFPAQKCGQARGPCSAAQIGSATAPGAPGILYQECPDSTGCPSGYYCEGLTGASHLGYPWATCLEVEPNCGREVGGPCCPGTEPRMPHCPAEDLYCQVRAWMVASINDTYCLKIGACGHEGQPICNHSTAGTAPGTYVNSEKDAQADVGNLRCDVSLYDNMGSILNRGNCTANPPDCGTLGKVACALPTGDDSYGYTLTCDKGLYVPNGSLDYYSPSNITTSTANITLPALDPSLDTAPQLVRGFVNATMTCQTCPPGDPQYDFACNFGVPNGIRPTA